MYFFRAMFGGAGFFSLLLLSTLGTGGCTGGLQKKRTYRIDCATKITVDPNSGVASNHKAVYVCGGDTITWDAKKGVTFTVHFPGACPFNPCPDITEANPSATVATQPVDLTLYKYTITVNGAPFDPHVVSGGGY